MLTRISSSSRFARRLSASTASLLMSTKPINLVSQLKLKLLGNDLGCTFFVSLQSSVEGYRLIDFENPANNDFAVVAELPYANGEDSFRPDITFLVNGVPLGFMEVKRENNKDGILAEHDRMHVRFNNEAYRHFANIVQIMVFSNNQEYDDEERKPIQGSFYAASAYGRLKFNRFARRILRGWRALWPIAIRR